MNLNFFKKSVIASFTFTIAGSYFVQAQEVGNERDIEEIVLVGVADIAKHRKTPVAVSTIKETTIIILHRYMLPKQEEVLVIPELT